MHILTDTRADLDDAVATLKALADPARLRVAALLKSAGELCVCEIVDVLGLPQYAVSRQLGVLKAAGLVEDRRSGQWVYYRLELQSRPFVHRVVQALDAVNSDRDAARLQERLSRRRDGVCVVGYGEGNCGDTYCSARRPRESC